MFSYKMLSIVRNVFFSSGLNLRICALRYFSSVFVQLINSFILKGISPSQGMKYNFKGY